jgi:hypothetical protein
MGNYQFEITMGFSDIIDVEADSYDEAVEIARREAEDYYVVAPAGFSLPWDDVQADCISEPDEED